MDLDPLEFERFRRSVRERRGRSDESLLELPNLELAKALGVIDANGTVRGVSLAALLLFGKEDALRRYVPSHEAAFQVLRALDVELNDFFHWPLLRVLEEIEVRIRARNREQELMVGITRREAAELCRIASHQARDLLARLVERGEFSMRGTKKGAFYVRMSKNMDDSKSSRAVSKNGPNAPNNGGMTSPRDTK